MTQLSREGLKEIVSDPTINQGSEFAEMARRLLAVEGQPSPSQVHLRQLVDVVWNAATESDEVPSTEWADQLIAAVNWQEAQPAPVAQPVQVPDDVLAALQKVAKIRLDLNDFDGDRRGIADCLGDAEEDLIAVVNRRAAMLKQPSSIQGRDDAVSYAEIKQPASNSPAVPDGIIAAVNRLLDSDGSRGCYSAVQCHEAHAEIEQLLAAAPKQESE